MDQMVLGFAANAGGAAVVLFAFGLVVLAARLFQTWRDGRKTNGLLEESKDKETLSDVLQIPEAKWPRALVPVRVAWERAHSRNTQLSHAHVDPPLRAVFERIQARGGTIRPISYALIVVALLATFLGMQNATLDLRASIDKLPDATVQASDPDDSAANKAWEESYENFNKNVKGALGEMGRAFGANLKGVFFAAALVLLLPLLRRQQTRTIRDIRQFVDLAVRARINDAAANALAVQLEKSLKRFSEEAVERLVRVVDESSKTLKSTASQLNEETLALTKQMAVAFRETLTDDRKKNAQQENDRLAEISRSLAEVTKFFEMLVHAFGTESSRYERTVQVLQEIGSRVQATVEETTGANQRSLAAQKELLEKALQTLDRGTKETTELAGSFGNAVMQHLGDWERASRDWHSKMDASLQALEGTVRGTGERLDKGVVDFLRAATEGKEGLASAGTSLDLSQRALSSLAAEVRDSHDRLAREAEEFRKWLGLEIQGHRQQLTDTLNQSLEVGAQSLATAIHDEVSSCATLVSQLDGTVKRIEESIPPLEAKLLGGATQLETQVTQATATLVGQLQDGEAKTTAAHAANEARLVSLHSTLEQSSRTIRDLAASQSHIHERLEVLSRSQQTIGFERRAPEGPTPSPATPRSPNDLGGVEELEFALAEGTAPASGERKPLGPAIG